MCIRWLINFCDSTKIHGAAIRFIVYTDLHLILFPLGKKNNYNQTHFGNFFSSLFLLQFSSHFCILLIFLLHLRLLFFFFPPPHFHFLPFLTVCLLSWLILAYFPFYLKLVQ